MESKRPLRKLNNRRELTHSPLRLGVPEDKGLFPSCRFRDFSAGADFEPAFCGTSANLLQWLGGGCSPDCPVPFTLG